jgi:hypothetical protein
MTPIQVTLAASAIVGISLHILFIRRLQQRCPDEWERLGSPNPLLPNNLQTGWRLTKYVLGGAFEHVSHKGVVRLGRILRLFEWVWVCGWLFYIGLVLFVVVPLWLRGT